MDNNISVVVPIFNSEKTIGRCLKALLSNDYPLYEIICVDDGSSDSSATIVGEMAKQDRRIILEKVPHGGPAAARNRGVKISRGDIIFFVDSDVFVRSDTLAIMVDCSSRENVSCVTPLIVPFRKNNIFEEFEDERHKNVFGVTNKFVKLAPTYAFLVGKQVFTAVGGFDEAFRLPAAEDYDLSLRLDKAGYKIFHCVDALASHDHACNMQSLLRRAFFYGREGVKFSARHKRVYVEVFLVALGLFAPFKALVRRSLRMGAIGFIYSAAMTAGRFSGLILYGFNIFGRKKYE